MERHHKEYGLNRCLRALGVAKSTWYQRQRRPRVSGSGHSPEDEDLKEKVSQIIKEHPAYGYRRIQVELRVRYGLRVNHKRLRRLLKKWDLALKRQVVRSRPSAVRRILKEGRGNLNLLRGRKLEPFEALCTDFTKVRYAQGTRKAQLMAMVDPASGWVGAWAVGESANRQLALRCWDKAKDNLARLGRSVRGLLVHHDQDTVYVSYRWLRQLLIEDEVVVSYCERA